MSPGVTNEKKTCFVCLALYGLAMTSVWNLQVTRLDLCMFIHVTLKSHLVNNNLFLTATSRLVYEIESELV